MQSCDGILSLGSLKSSLWRGVEYIYLKKIKLSLWELKQFGLVRHFGLTPVHMLVSLLFLSSFILIVQPSSTPFWLSTASLLC